MDKKSRAVIIGLALGDGYMYKRHTKGYDSWVLKVKHDQNQKAYIEHKASLLERVYGRKPKVYSFNNNGYSGYEIQKADKYFRILYKWLYPNRKKTYSGKVLKYLNEQALALWYMDDGSLSAKKRNGIIHAYELHINTYCSKEECETIVNYMKSSWNVNFTIVKNKNLYRIRCGTKEARKFLALIDSYIIDSMRYKSLDNMKPCTFVKIN